MKNYIVKALTAFFVLLCLAYPAPVHAQHEQLDRQREAEDLRVEKIRARLDKVRKTRKRPTVAKTKSKFRWNIASSNYLPELLCNVIGIITLNYIQVQISIFTGNNQFIHPRITDIKG